MIGMDGCGAKKVCGEPSSVAFGGSGHNHETSGFPWVAGSDSGQPLGVPRWLVFWHQKFAYLNKMLGSKSPLLSQFFKEACQLSQVASRGPPFVTSKGRHREVEWFAMPTQLRSSKTSIVINPRFLTPWQRWHDRRGTWERSDLCGQGRHCRSCWCRGWNSALQEPWGTAHSCPGESVLPGDTMSGIWFRHLCIVVALLKETRNERKQGSKREEAEKNKEKLKLLLLSMPEEQPFGSQWGDGPLWRPLIQEFVRNTVSFSRTER